MDSKPKQTTKRGTARAALLAAALAAASAGGCANTPKDVNLPAPNIGTITVGAGGVQL